MAQKIEKINPSHSNSCAQYSSSSRLQQPSLINKPVQTIFTLKADSIKYHNILDTTQIIFKEEGLLGFFTGVRMRMAIQSVSSAIAWGTYQVVSSTINGGRSKFKE